MAAKLLERLSDEVRRVNEFDVIGRLRSGGEPLSIPEARRWIAWRMIAFGFGAFVSQQLGFSIRDAALGPYFWAALGLVSAGAGDVMPRERRTAWLLIQFSRVLWIVAIAMVPVFLVRAVLGGFEVP